MTEELTARRNAQASVAEETSTEEVVETVAESVDELNE